MSEPLAAAGEPITEHALLMSSGAMQVRNGHPDIERIYPLEQWITNEIRTGAQVYRRRIVVIEDWEQVVS